MSDSFIEKLEQIIQTNQTHVVLRISPHLMQMPTPVKAYDDPFLPFGKAVINATRDVVAGYIFDFPAYLAIGAAGAVALERTIGYVDRTLITIIDGQFSGAGYVHLADEGTFNADALILADDNHLSAYTARPDRSAFVTYDHTPHSAPTGGIFWRMTDELTIGDKRLKIVGDDVVYADGTAHFGDSLHEALLGMRDS
ncbi:MAG: hypothetical protein SH821_06455 [Phototrophicales bacterium]|nr:hypothetical protein [Phototrophicales bacterium]